jgi:hypothetical protein
MPTEHEYVISPMMSDSSQLVMICSDSAEFAIGKLLHFTEAGSKRRFARMVQGRHIVRD